MIFQFLKKRTAIIWAKKHVQKAQLFKENAVEDQHKLLLNLIKTAEKTLFGKAHQFETIHSVKDFQKLVPLADYEDLKPYIDKVRNGEKNVLWTGVPKYFAQTSGTTSGSKYIPISKEGILSQTTAARSALFHYITKKGNADFLDGKMIFVQGDPNLEEINGVKIGRLSGIVAHHVPKYLQKNRLPTWKTNRIVDWETKVHKIVEETKNENMTFVSGNPPWLLMYFEYLIASSGKKIKELFPNLQLLMTGGVNYEPYREKMEKLLGGRVDTIQSFPSSEGFFAFQDDFEKEGLLFLTKHGIFYEFIPLEDYGKADAKRLTLGDIGLHKDYALIITTNSGLWAYAIGDVVRFISKEPHRVLVSGRTKHYCSAFGEHVIAFEIEDALKATVAKFPAEITEFHLAPQVNPEHGLPYHEWFIEFNKAPDDLEKFRLKLDLEMTKRNIYYEGMISGKVLQTLKISRLKKNAFQDYAKSVGKLGGQNKIPRLANDRIIADFLKNYEV